ncbi:MAG: hypothetical protein K8S62_11620 [Candidatus Sabulitectum sp.]|nr:hypothetical protein [Candidatus Sabulitectum sp.]
MLKLFIVLIAGYAIADFLVCTHRIQAITEKYQFSIVSSAIHAIITYAVLQVWLCWQIPLLIFLIHFLIDLLIHHRSADSTAAFIVCKSTHIVGLFAASLLLAGTGWITGFTGTGYLLLVQVAGFIGTVQGSGQLIDRFTSKIKETNNLVINGLAGGGKLIGELERMLIFLFIFIGYPAGIGFLVAAKSILRFEEAKKQKLAEYVLIGTLLSFSMAIVGASVTKWATEL